MLSRRLYIGLGMGGVAGAIVAALVLHFGSSGGGIVDVSRSGPLPSAEQAAGTEPDRAESETNPRGQAFGPAALDGEPGGPSSGSAARPSDPLDVALAASEGRPYEGDEDFFDMFIVDQLRVFRQRTRARGLVSVNGWDAAEHDLVRRVGDAGWAYRQEYRRVVVPLDRELSMISASDYHPRPRERIRELEARIPELLDSLRKRYREAKAEALRGFADLHFPDAEPRIKRWIESPAWVDEPPD